MRRTSRRFSLSANAWPTHEEYLDVFKGHIAASCRSAIVAVRGHRSITQGYYEASRFPSPSRWADNSAQWRADEQRREKQTRLERLWIQRERTPKLKPQTIAAKPSRRVPAVDTAQLWREREAKRLAAEFPWRFVHKACGGTAFYSNDIPPIRSSMLLLNLDGAVFQPTNDLACASCGAGLIPNVAMTYLRVKWKALLR